MTESENSDGGEPSSPKEPAEPSAAIAVSRPTPTSLLDRFSLWPSVETAMRTLVSLVPGLGGAVNELVFGYLSARKAARLEETLVALTAEVGRLSATSLDEQFMGTDEFGDIVEGALRGSLQTASASKRARFRRLLLGAARPHAHRMRAETFLAAVTELSDADIALLVAIHASEAEGHPDPVGGRRLPAASEELDMLQRFGFVQVPPVNEGGFLVTQGTPPSRPTMTALGYSFFDWVLQDAERSGEEAKAD